MADETSETPKGTKRGLTTPKAASRSPKRNKNEPSSPMDITPEAVNSVSRIFKIGGGLHFEEMKGFDNDILKPEIEAFPDIVHALLFSEDTASKTEAATQLKLLVSKGHILPIFFAMESNVIPKLLVFLADNNFPKLQYMSTSIIADISMAKSIESLEKEVVDSMVNILCSDSIKNNSTKEEAVRALGNIAGGSEESRFLVIEVALKSLMDQYLNTQPALDNVSLHKMMQWSILMLYNGTAPLDMPYQDIITLAKELIQSQVSGHKEVACRTLYFITQKAPENVRLTIADDETIILSIENLLQFPSSYTVSVLTLLPKVMSRVLLVKAMPFLNMYLQSSDTRIPREDIIDAGLITTLLNASKKYEQDLKKLALSTISKITDQLGKVEDKVKDAESIE